MKKFILLGLLFCSVANAEIPVEGNSMGSSQKIYAFKEDNGTTLLTIKKPKDSKLGNNYEREILKNEDGDFIKNESVKVIPTYYPDMDKWENAGCKVDRFNGKKSCEVRKDILYVVNLSGKTSVMIIGADYPNKQSAIKIDENATIYGVEGLFDNDQKIINQLLKGKTAYVRYVEWPYSYNKNIEIDLSGFKEAYQEMKKEYAALK